MYSVRLLKNASKEFEKLDRTVAIHIVERLEWLSSNLDSTKLFPLKGELSGLYKLREGSHRIIFEILKSEKIIIVHAIGHRREIYKRR
jgi:mRNA interferase RelE/StbE